MGTACSSGAVTSGWRALDVPGHTVGHAPVPEAMIHDFDSRDSGIGSSDRLSLILIALGATLLGAASFVYAVATYQRGGGTQTFWKTVVMCLLLAAPVAVVIGGFLCVFPATRRPGRRVLAAGLGVVLGFVGLIAVVLLLFWAA